MGNKGGKGKKGAKGDSGTAPKTGTGGGAPAAKTLRYKILLIGDRYFALCIETLLSSKVPPEKALCC
jgi:hypothetical protein